MEFPNVEFSKFPEIDEVDSALLYKTLEHFFKKVSIEEGDTKLHLTVKEYKKGGLRAQHEVHANLFLGGKQYFSQVTGWQLLEAVQESLKKVEKEVQKVHSKK
ncbi:MAG: hypothetical protein AABW59_02910 [archaeon]